MTDTDTGEKDPELMRITRRNKSDWEVVPETESVTVAPKLGAMISVRFEPEVAGLIRRAAKLAELSQSEFVRRAAEAQARQLLSQPPVRISAREGSSPPLIWNPAKAGNTRREEAVSASSATELEPRPTLHRT